MPRVRLEHGRPQALADARRRAEEALLGDDGHQRRHQGDLARLEAERAVRVHAGVERVRRRARAGGHEHAAHDQCADGLEAAVAVGVVLVRR